MQDFQIQIRMYMYTSTRHPVKPSIYRLYAHIEASSETVVAQTHLSVRLWLMSVIFRKYWPAQLQSLIRILDFGMNPV